MKIKLTLVAILSVSIVGMIVFQMLPSASSLDQSVAHGASPVNTAPPKVVLEKKSYALDSSSIQNLKLVHDPFETPTDLQKQHDKLQAEFLAKQPVTPVVPPNLQDPNLQNIGYNLGGSNGHPGLDGQYPNGGVNGNINGNVDTTPKGPAVAQGLIDQTVQTIADEYRIDPLYVKAIIAVECSSNDVNCTNLNDNGTIDRGLMQINSKTAPLLAIDLGIKYNVGIEFDLETNLRMGIYYLDSLRKSNSNIEYILSAYNLGDGGAKALYAKTGSYKSVYSAKVLKKYDELVNSL